MHALLEKPTGPSKKKKKKKKREREREKRQTEKSSLVFFTPSFKQANVASKVFDLNC